MPSNAEKCRNYRNRIKAGSQKIKKPPLTSTERSRLYRLRKKQLSEGNKSFVNELYTPSTNLQITYETLPQSGTTILIMPSNAERCENYRNRIKAASQKTTKPPLTPAERSRLYRLRKKQLGQGNKSSVNELYTPSSSNSRINHAFEPLSQTVTTSEESSTLKVPKTENVFTCHIKQETCDIEYEIKSEWSNGDFEIKEEACDETEAWTEVPVEFDEQWKYCQVDSKCIKDEDCETGEESHVVKIDNNENDTIYHIKEEKLDIDYDIKSEWSNGNLNTREEAWTETEVPVDVDDQWNGLDSNIKDEDVENGTDIMPKIVRVKSETVCNGLDDTVQREFEQEQEDAQKLVARKSVNGDLRQVTPTDPNDQFLDVMTFKEFHKVGTRNQYWEQPYVRKIFDEVFRGDLCAKEASTTLGVAPRTFNANYCKYVDMQQKCPSGETQELQSGEVLTNSEVGIGSSKPRISIGVKRKKNQFWEQNSFNEVPEEVKSLRMKVKKAKTLRLRNGFGARNEDSEGLNHTVPDICEKGSSAEDLRIEEVKSAKLKTY